MEKFQQEEDVCDETLVELRFGSRWSIPLASTCLSAPWDCLGAVTPGAWVLPAAFLGLLSYLSVPGGWRPSQSRYGTNRCGSASLAVQRLVFMKRVDVIEQIAWYRIGIVAITCLHNLNFFVSFQIYLKEILREIGIYNVKGTHKNTWELKPEYRHYQGEDKSD